MITKDTNLKEAVDKYPEIASVLAQAGLHCVGCHSSASETIEDGCKVHGFDNNQVEEIVKQANEKIKKVNTLPPFKLTKKALEKLKVALKEQNAKYVRILPIFGGFDFDAVNEKQKEEILIEDEVPIILSPNLERFLRGVKIDFDEKENDYTAKRED